MAVKRENFDPPELEVRRVDGVPIYSHAVSVAGGRQVYIAGQLSRDAQGNVVGRGDMRAQTVQVFENLKIALAAAGATLDDVVQTSTFVTDIEAYFAVSAVRREYFPNGRPTSTTVEVSRLAHPDLMIEISAIAVVE